MSDSGPTVCIAFIHVFWLDVVFAADCRTISRRICSWMMTARRHLEIG